MHSDWRVLAGGNMDRWQKIGKLCVIEQILTIWGRLPQRLWFGFPDSLLQRLWVKFYFIHGQTVVCLYTQSVNGITEVTWRERKK